MPELDPKPHPFRPGLPLSARSLNRTLESQFRQFRGNRTAQVADYGDRTVVGVNDRSTILPGAGNYLQQFVVLEEYDDLLLCTPLVLPTSSAPLVTPNDGRTAMAPTYSPLNGLTDPETQQPSLARVWVAKPYALQRLPWE